MKEHILKMGEFSQEDAQVRVYCEDLEKLKKEVKNLLDYASLVEKDINDRDTGWYYQFQSAIDRTQRVLKKMDQHEVPMRASMQKDEIMRMQKLIMTNGSYGKFPNFTKEV